MKRNLYQLLYKDKNMIPMPVNLPRVIKNIVSENKIKPNSISDLDPEYFFRERARLLD